MKLRVCLLSPLVVGAILGAVGCNTPAASDTGDSTDRDKASSKSKSTRGGDDDDAEEAKTPIAKDKPAEGPAFAVEQTSTADAAFVRWGAHAGRRADGSTLVFGGFRFKEQKNDVNIVSLKDGAPESTALSTTDAPAARSRGAFFVDPDADRAYVRGGRLSGAAIAEGDTFVLDVATKKWSKLALAPQPEAIVGPATVWSVAKKAGYLFGGAVTVGSAAWFGETWRFDTKPAPAWTKIDVDGPSARYDSVLLATDDGAQLVLFGGGKGIQGSGAFENDVWTFDTATETWTEVKNTGVSAPTPRRGAFGALSKHGHELFVACGESADAALTDAWRFDLNTGVWTPVFESGKLPESTFSTRISAAGSPGWLFGGYVSNGADVNAQLLRFDTTATTNPDW